MENEERELQRTGAHDASEPPAIPLVSMTIAKLYAAQGHAKRAIEVLQQVIASDAENAPARTMLIDLRAQEMNGEGAVAIAGNVCETVMNGDGSLLVRWGCTEEAVRRIATYGAELVIRAVVILPTWDGPKVDVHDTQVSAAAGEITLSLARFGDRAIVRVAVGIRYLGEFAALAHAA